jgi:hypothetical protein
MSQKLTSAEFYEDPSHDEVLADVRTSHSRDALSVAKVFLNLLIWLVILGVLAASVYEWI